MAITVAPPSPILVAAVAAPWGPIHLAADSESVLALEVLTPADAFVAAVERRFRRPVEIARAGRAADGVLDHAMDQVAAYLRGARRVFDLPIRLDDRPGWDRAVLGGVRQLGWGSVSSYGGIARLIGRPGAARAVGGAVGRNPIGLLIPCHRVIAGDGSIGGYGGAWYGTRERLLEIKRELLAIEGVALPARIATP